MAVPLPVTLVSAPQGCAKCAACEAMLGRLSERFAGRLDIRKYTTEDAEAEIYGVVMPPLLVVDGFLVTMGSVPDESRLAQLIQKKLEA